MMSDKQFENTTWFQALPKHYWKTILKEKNPTTDSLQQASP